MFYQILKDLAEYFHLYVVDWLGMGSSGRPDYRCDDVDKAEAFFLESFRIWKEKVGIDKNAKYYLAGHSLGGYLSTVYALKH